MTADGVDLVNEDQAGAVLLGALEEVADTAGADADEHLDELRTGEGEEGNTGLTRDGFGKQGFTGSRRANQQHTLGDFCAHRGEALGGLQEGDDLLQVLFGFFNAGDVVEHHAGLGFHQEACLGLTELHGLTGAAGHAATATAGEQHQATDQQEREEQVAQQSEGRRCRARGVDVKADALLLEVVDQFRSQAGEINPQALNAVVEVGINGFHDSRAAAVKNVNGGHAAGIDVIDEPAVAHPSHRSVTGGNGGAGGGAYATETAAQHLPAEEDGDANGENPQGNRAPALIHGRLRCRSECLTSVKRARPVLSRSQAVQRFFPLIRGWISGGLGPLHLERGGELLRLEALE